MSGTTWKITGKGSGGQCEHCPRQLATHYVITNAEGQSMKVGRGCLKKVTGWTVTAAQAEARIRVAAREARWQAWCEANPAEAAIVNADAEREAAEVRSGARQVAGPAQEVRTLVGDQGYGWQEFLAFYLANRAA